MKYNLLGYALAASSVLWLLALLSADVTGTIATSISTMAVGSIDAPKLPLEELQRRSHVQSFILVAVGLIYVFVLPMLPLLLIRWAKWYYRLLSVFGVCAILAFAIS